MNSFFSKSVISIGIGAVSRFCHLQLCDAGGDGVVEIGLQPYHFGLQLHLFLLHVGQPVFSHLSVSLLLSRLGLSKEHLSILSSSPTAICSAAGSCRTQCHLWLLNDLLALFSQTKDLDLSRNITENIEESFCFHVSCKRATASCRNMKGHMRVNVNTVKNALLCLYSIFFFF